LGRGEKSHDLMEYLSLTHDTLLGYGTPDSNQGGNERKS
jgi:hypothetical protein